MNAKSPATPTLYGVQITGVGAQVPPTVLTNDDLTQLVETSDEWIATRTGIRERHVVAGSESVGELATAAARDALRSANVRGEDIELILVATSTHDVIYPAVACQVQQAIGAKGAAGYDIAVACTGFTCALITAYQFLRLGTYKKALVVGVDVHSRVMDWTDRNTCVLFGDGAGAAVLEATPDAPDHFLGFDMNMDGSRGEQLHLRNYRPNCPLVSPHLPPEGDANPGYLSMNGKEVYKFAVITVPASIEKVMAHARLTPENLDHLVLHQANIRIMEAMSQRLKIPMEKQVVNVERYGNTSAATIPIALNEAVLEGRFKPGDSVIFCGYGAGLTWATVAVEWTAVDHRPEAKAATGEKKPKALSGKASV